MATAGTDTHSPRDYAAGPGFNVVYAEGLSERAILAALRAGHLYLSAGPRLDLHAVDETGAHRMMGEAVHGAATFHLAWSEFPVGAQLRVMVNGRVLHQQPIAVRGEHVWSLSPDEANWVVVEVRDGHGGMLAVSNTVYLSEKGSSNSDTGTVTDLGH